MIGHCQTPERGHPDSKQHPSPPFSPLNLASCIARSERVKFKCIVEASFYQKIRSESVRKVRIVIIDDHKIVRRGLRSILEQDESFEVMGEASNGSQGLLLISQLKPDIALIDIRLNSMSGIDLCRSTSKLSPDTKVIILTAYLDGNLIHQALQAGVKGYLLKDAEQMDLINRIHRVLNGELVFDPRVTTSLAKYAIRHPPQENDVLLSGRDVEILRLIAQGMTNAEIADILLLSPATVKDYVRNITNKLGARNRVEAVTKAVRSGLI